MRIARPTPVQPRLPIHVGGAGPKLTLPIVREHADWWNCVSTGVERLAELLPLVGDVRISVQHPVALAESEAVREAVRNARRNASRAGAGSSAARRTRWPRRSRARRAREWSSSSAFSPTAGVPKRSSASREMSSRPCARSRSRVRAHAHPARPRYRRERSRRSRRTPGRGPPSCCPIRARSAIRPWCASASRAGDTAAATSRSTCPVRRVAARRAGTRRAAGCSSRATRCASARATRPRMPRT